MLPCLLMALLPGSNNYGAGMGLPQTVNRGSWIGHG